MTNLHHEINICKNTILKLQWLCQNCVRFLMVMSAQVFSLLADGLTHERRLQLLDKLEGQETDQEDSNQECHKR